VHSDEIAEVEVSEHRERSVAELVLAEIELDPARRIREMRKRRFAVATPCDDTASHRHRWPFRGIPHQRVRGFSGVLPVERVRIRLYSGGLQRFQLFSARLEDEVQILGHAAAVVDSPVCLRYASMNGSIAPSITFCTSGILSSVR